MAELRSETTTEAGQLDKTEPITTNGINEPANNTAPVPKVEKTGKSKDKKEKKRSSDKKRKSKKAAKYTDSSSSDSDADAAGSSASSDDSSSSSDEDRRKKKDKKKAKLKLKKKPVVSKKKKHSKSRPQDSSSSSSDSSSDSSDSDSEKETDKRKREKSKKGKSVRSDSSSATSDSEDKATGSGNDDANASKSKSVEASGTTDNIRSKFLELLDQMMDEKVNSKSKSKVSKDKQKKKDKELEKEKQKDRETDRDDNDHNERNSEKKDKPKKKRGSVEDYKRVDQLWDTDIHDYKLTESKDRERHEEFDEYTFTVRRVFNWENKYQETVVDIKSKYLKEALQEVLKDVKGISLEEDKPSLDPKMLFLYLEELRTFYRKTLKTRSKKAKKAKHTRRLNKMRVGVKLLVKYLDEDYDDTKKKLYPMLENGQITFDLLWALFKPNTIAYTSTYGASEHPRCYKVDFANKESSFTRGEWYSIEGRYLEYDGKSFGYGDFEATIDKFPGSRKITSLTAYPLSYHSNPEGMRKTLVERGKKFVDLAGMKYKYHEGMSFHKKKRQVLRLNTNGRCMVDPNMFRRILPNYPISILTPKNRDDDSDDEGAPGAEQGSSEFDGGSHDRGNGDGEVRTASRVIRDKDGDYKVVDVPVDESGKEVRLGAHETLGASNPEERSFTDDELLIASPVVLGFAFSEKQWMEFTVSGVREIDWNDDAFDSLVIPEDRKSIVKALVSAHKFKASKTIDDVVQGKGRGLVFVLHGPPGCGKTLTCEAIAELLRCPLYSVTSGDLGLSAHEIETELNRIMQVAQAWGAVLLLDEADVFLEKRQVQDIGRNSLVSVFLRLLEYFQGVLFLTTNRVDTFDDAFQSRIHLPLRYEELSFKAKREIWRMFLQRVQDMEVKNHQEDLEDAKRSKTDASPVAAITKDSTPQVNGSSGVAEKSAASLESMFTDADLNGLARHSLNGRQIKNTVRTAQAIAVHEGQRLSLQHIQRVLAVTEAFDRELKGGTGYLDAMRSYT